MSEVSKEEETPPLLSEVSDLPRRKLESCEIGRDTVALHHSFGIDVLRRNNLAYLREGLVLYAAGNALILWDTLTQRREYLFGRDGRGIGAVAVHPSRKYFAVGEKGSSPCIYVYKMPEAGAQEQPKVVRVLRKGTELAFSDMNFSANGDKLVSVGAYPDFLLTVWDWKEERIILHAKAFGQEVFNALFSPHDDGFLVTSGTGHIRFWKMASTFTGLKLQGDIGKFGKVELTDIAAFAELPDGKVLSGTEGGLLLLWEAPFIRCAVNMLGGANPHQGEITVIRLETDTGVPTSPRDSPRAAMENSTVNPSYFVTAGADGWIRWWDFDAIDSAEVDDDHPDFELAPLEQIHLGAEIEVKTIVRGGKGTADDHYLIQDASGGLWRMELPSKAVTRVMSCHAGAIMAVDCSPVDHFAATAGIDGTVRCWDYVEKRQLFSKQYPSAATALIWAPPSVDPRARTVIVGYDNGVTRILVRGADDWKMKHVVKPHNAKVNVLAFSPDGAMLATGGDDNMIFLLRVSGANGEPYEPIGFQPVSGAVNCLSWRPDGQALIAVCANGSVLELDLCDPTKLKPVTDDTYELNMPSRTYPISTRVLEQRRAQLSGAASSEPAESESTGTDAADVEPASGDDSNKTDDDSKEDPSAAVQSEDQPAADNKGAGSGEADAGDADATPEAAAAGEEVDPFAAAAQAREDAATSALTVLYMPGGASSQFLLTLGGGNNQAGAIFLCDFDNADAGPLECLSVGLGPKAVAGTAACVNTLRFSNSGNFIVSGADDGSVCLRSTGDTRSAFARVLAHDGDGGPVSGVALSFDDQFLVTGGGEGVLQVHRVKPQEVLSRAAAVHAAYQERIRAADMVRRKPGAAAENRLTDAKEVEISAAVGTAASVSEVENMFALEDMGEGDCSSATANALGFDEVVSSVANDQHDEAEESAIESAAPPDIIKEDAYSIQDAKLKTEEDLRLAAAEAKKEAVREVIRGMRAEFQRLLDTNADQPEPKQLERSEFTIDPAFDAMLRERGEALCEEVRKEMEFEQEKCQLALSKLRRRFIDSIEVEGLTLTALRSSHRVTSFRTMQLSDELQEALKSVHALIDIEDSNKRRDNASSATAAKPGDGASGAGAGAGQGADSAGLGMDADLQDKSSSFEVRKFMRGQRKQRMDRLVADKPAADAEDPRDVDAIKYAEGNMGDYKLKTAKDYVVPEEQRVNADKKRRQMVLLEESIHAIKMGFNVRLLSLRELKRQIIEHIAQDNARMKEIDAELATGLETDQWQPLTDPAEWPEERSRVTEDEIKAFAANATAIERTPPSADSLTVESDLLQANPLLVSLPIVDASSWKTDGSKSNLEAQENDVRMRLLENERKTLFDKTEQTVSMFDEALCDLRREKLMLEADLKTADMRLLILCQELALLHNFEAKDTALASKLDKCRTDKAQVVADITDCHTRLSAKRAELEVWQEKDTAIMEEFHGLVSENHPFHAQLLKIFKRKIKRAKKRGSDDEDEDDEDDDDFDDDDDYDDDDDLEDEDEDDSCPPGCEQALYDQVLELREKRLDQEEVLQEFQRSIDELKRNHDRHVQRERQIDKDLKQTENEIQSFQTEKQGRLNQLNVVVTMKLSQLLCLQSEEDGGDPSKLVSVAGMHSHLLFAKGSLKRLDERAAELEVENKEKRAEFKELHREQTRLTRERASKEAEISALTAKCEDLQMLKFGQIIDLANLDKMSGIKNDDNLRSKIDAIEMNNERQITSIKGKFNGLREQLLTATQENTQLLDQIADLSARQFQLEKELNRGGSDGAGSGGAVAVADAGPAVRREVEERNRLVSLVKLQAKEVDALKAEINMLRRKGGHVYATQPPAPPQDVVGLEMSANSGL